MSTVLFNGSDERIQLPTLRNWIKSQGNKKIAQSYIVNTIWFPTKFPNIVFETERFRALVYNGNPQYEAIRGFVLEYDGTVGGLAVSPNREEPGKFELIALDKEKPSVEFIGEFGLRIKYE